MNYQLVANTPTNQGPWLSRQRGYRFGFNGMEKDDEFNGAGNSYTTQYRQYDARLSRWLSMDPVQRHSLSMYQAFSNNPIIYIDLKGNLETQVIDEGGNIIYDDNANDGNVFYVDANKNELEASGFAFNKQGRITSPNALNSLSNLGLSKSIVKNWKLDPNASDADIIKFLKANWDFLARKDQVSGNNFKYGIVQNSELHKYLQFLAPKETILTFDVLFGNNIEIYRDDKDNALSVVAWENWNEKTNSLNAKAVGQLTFNVEGSAEYLGNIYTLRNALSHEKKHVVDALVIKSKVFNTKADAQNWVQNDFELKAYKFMTEHWTFLKAKDINMPIGTTHEASIEKSIKSLSKE
ncbi:hypothetical protein GC194_10815 [bacterium]|nr:hypothetical protein [bacterium]